MKIKLSNLKTDETLLQIRPIDPYTVNRYRQAMRAGAGLPLIVAGYDRRIVVGNHRYEAMLQEYGEETVIHVKAMKFETELERLEFAIRSNVTHGEPLGSFSRKLAILKLEQLGSTPEAIAALLDVAPEKVVEIAGMRVVVTGGRGQVTMPLKRGLEHLAGGNMTAEQYNAHLKRDRGIPARAQAEQLTRWLRAGWVDMEDEDTAEVFAALKAVL